MALWVLSNYHELDNTEMGVCFFFFLLAVLGLLWCSGFSLVAASRGRSPLSVLGLLIVVVSLAAEHGPLGVLAHCL